MVYTIYSIGDSAFLQAILNAIAMIAQTGDYRMAGGIGALIGVLFVCLRSLMQWDGRGLRYQDMLLAILIYMTLFVPGVTVDIEDAYTGQVRVVNNVPFGPAVTGSILSNMGYRLTYLFEQGFSTPSMTQHGFADALQVLTTVRKNLLSRIELGKANSPVSGSDIENSVVNYVKECTLTGVDLNLLSLDTILRSNNVLNGLRFDSDIYTTEIYTGGKPSAVSCTEAWSPLQSLIESQGMPAIEARLSAVLGVQSGGEVPNRVQVALDALTQGQVNATDYMLAAALLPMFEKGVVGRHEDSLHWDRAAMVEQAIQQRNTQWTSEQTLFARIVRPMMAWIEGFSYAITPLMAFAVMLGATGIRMSGQYVLMLLWVQLWMPILAIINLYITLSATAGFAALNLAQFNLPSIAGIYQMDMEIQNWLAVGGMLASSTPAIALMLVYGGSITATHFLGRMQSGDFVDEKLASPPILNPAAMIGMQSMHQHGPLTGTHMTGSDKVLPTFQIGRDVSASVSSSFGALKQSSQNFMESLSHQAGQSSSLNHEGTDSLSLSRRMSSTGSETDRFIQSTGEDFAQRYRDTGMSGNDFASLISGGLGGQMGYRSGKLAGIAVDEKGTPGLTGGIQGSLTDQLQNRFHVGSSQANEIASDLSSRISQDQGWQAELARSISRDAQVGTREVASLGLTSQNLSSLQQSAQDTISASNQYQESISTQQRFATTSNIGAAEAGLRIANNPDSFGALEKSLDQVGLRGDAQRLSAEWQSMGLINDPKQSYAAAGASLLTGYSSAAYRHLSSDDARLAENLGHVVLGEAFRAPYPSDAAHSASNAHIQTEAPSFDGVRATVESTSFGDPMHATQGLSGRVTAEIGERSGYVADGTSTIMMNHDAYQNDVRNEHSSSLNSLHHEQSEHYGQKIHEAASETQSIAEMNYDKIGGFIYGAATEVSRWGEASVDGFIKTYDEGVATGKSSGSAMMNAIKRFPHEASIIVEHWANDQVELASMKLTPGQQQFYKSQLMGVIPGSEGSSEKIPNAMLETLSNEGSERSSEIASLIHRAASQNRPDLLELIGRYNKSRIDG
ncbi:MAG: conjugal transfer protein TraG [Gammaproteobacteria bacterium]|nr:conjugal transfer protein TraG [Gammaproteobacteria bacterium]NBT43343.1 conjugal transfer protein TraG [Gammaproteobacteria bacterium]NBY21784.1 conjugal transfer protein TraG [Gammaproteobacteria bacterium]NDE33394.1 conjugal transfer protein TraG [Gammaproteobacteria bacterium]NDE55410.1 conjugal transfer protein TraG [Gammaproteobacteria bacterium]